MKYIIVIGCLILATACHNASPGSKSPVAGQATAATPTSGQMKDTAAATDTSIAGEWYLVPQLASDSAAGKLPAIRFDVAVNAFSGNTGCNVMRGTYVKAGDSIVFNKQVITTRMACIGYNEKAFLDNLFRVNRFKLSGTELWLYENDAVLFKWSRKITTPLKKA
ncbi:META domain-containing protein [Deminuibacter soli]|uniref:META domain-containing protein n=1 Tax=Deminuibacter soli TaxID=2291815 RepID=A0A3E1NQW8_9BACT|nr:META domain-containing protein [Deminuibacter soli]RFM30325.1 META domain-containing protein [Deminuibacter soli]